MSGTASSATGWDESVDVVVVGSGAGALAGALAAVCSIAMESPFL